jgi:transcriptional regulator of heat shock response
MPPVLSERTSQILKAAVKGFIDTGLPVSSEWLYENYDFGIKPAMIRLELNALSDMGFLEQPHRAAGRVPTDRGYEFYAQNLVSEDSPASCARALADLFRRRAWPEFLEEFSSELDILGTASVFPQGAVYKSMLANLIDRLDWPAVELRSLIHDFENLEERLAAMPSAAAGEEIKIFIGRKSPITKSENLAVMAASYDFDRSRVFVCAIGPKRMDYGKTAGVMKGLKRVNGKGRKANGK